MTSVIERPDKRPTDDQVDVVCAALRAHRGANVYAFADRQLGMARHEALASWLAIIRRLRM